MSEWRPEGKDWNRNRARYLEANTLLAISIENKATYEAGANAMLAALREMAKKTSPEEWMRSWYPPTVLISDKE